MFTVGLKFDSINFPTPITQTCKAESQNNLAISVFGWEIDVVVYRVSKRVGKKNLMLYTDKYS